MTAAVTPPYVARVVRGSERILASTIPWLVVFALFIAANAYIHRQWIWIVGDDQNLMMPAIDLGRGYTPNLDFFTGYPGLTFYGQRLVMLVFGEQPVAEHVYTALQAILFGAVAAWVLRRWYPPALVWLVVLFLWSQSHAINPTPNPGFMVQPLVILAMYVMERLGRVGRLSDAVAAGALASLAFLFKQYGIMLPVGFALYASFACLASANGPRALWVRAAIVLLNAAALIGYFWVYLVRSVFTVPHGNPEAAASLPASTVAFLSPWVFALAVLAFLAIRPRPLFSSGFTTIAFVKANAAFAASFLAVGTIAFGLMYGVGSRSVDALRAVLFTAPDVINGNVVAIDPLLLWPVAVICLVVVGPLVLRELQNPFLQSAMLIGIAAAVLFAARTFMNPSLTLAPTVVFFALVGVFLWARPTGDAWSWFFVFLAGSVMLAYLVPYPAYPFNMGILIVAGWAMAGGTFQSPWPRLVNPIGAAAVAAILALVLLDARTTVERMPSYEVGTHTVKSSSAIGPAVDAANASTPADAQHELYTYFIYLAHLP